METKKFDPARRSFLFAVGAAPAAGLAVMIAAQPEPGNTASQSLAQPEPATGSYRETEHIRKYYYAASYF